MKERLMLNLALPPLYGLGQTRRINPMSCAGENVSELGVAALCLAGAIAAVAVVAFTPALHIPGHAILRAALPMVCGIAAVPRRMAGSIMAASAAATAGVFSMSGWGNWQPAAVVALCAFGPAIDLALAGRSKGGWLLYLRFALAGVLANSTAFVLRGGIALFGLNSSRPHFIARFDLGVFLSFAACGAIAGLLAAVVCFRTSPKSEESLAEVR
ncbi:MAG TPA: hypothetical protein VKB78_15665 [Pirellulales bacterium]|nr:hypothetical protein [Pirellulales bacterium]